MTEPAQKIAPEDRCRLYLITPPRIDDPQAFAALLMKTLAAGDVACLQIRLKDADGTPASDDHIRAVTRAILPVAQGADVAVLLNDRPDLAKELGCDGVHIGQEDTPSAEARALLGADAIVGVTCHDSRHLAYEAAEAGADYVAFGAFFPTATKTPKTAADLDLLRNWSEIAEVPCVAIGGITLENAAAVVEAGADFIAVSGGVWNHPDGSAAAVAAFNRLLDETAAR
ncbi:MAG: thiamine phosphate synthase [Alphaproteobacteria bacterium]|nr:thiamine phosphate synthase [Alphaproteobacteria bacterium]MDX5367951.1 thiamine phosphate synthase [Alphaproteobacteria bacterium]MDX5462804.1 thiamine phosphate synthase [Alphaproteobacteria bacterium]